MSITARYIRTEDAGFLRCDRPAMARRQLEMSIGLVVVLLIATFAALVSVPWTGIQSDVASVARVVLPAQKSMVIKASVRVIPMYNREAADQAQDGRHS
jgi:hypothetical protein